MVPEMRVAPVARQPQSHLPELDGIRGLAILGVLCSHGAGLTGIFDVAPHSLADKLLKFAMVPLWGGVDLFFALSGFLITGILLRTKTREHYFSSFYARRVLRIFPIYYLVLTLSLIAAHFSAGFASMLPPTTSWRFAYFIYLQNWPVFWHGAKSMEGFWGVYWSLAVEEQFYFVWPLIVLLCSERTITRICCAGIVCALPLRIFLSYRYFGDNFGFAQITSSRVDGLFVGAACAVYMFQNDRPVPMRWIVAAASLGAAIVAYIAVFHPLELVATGRWILTLGITGYALLSGALVAISQHRIRFINRILTLSWLRMAGKYSYGIYVYHLFIFLTLRGAILRLGWLIHSTFPERVLILLLEVLVAFVVAILSFELYETPFLRLKKYFKTA